MVSDYDRRFHCGLHIKYKSKAHVLEFAAII